MNRTIEFYRLSDNSCPVESFLDSLDEKVAQKVLAVFKYIEEMDLVPAKFFKKLSGTDILECRIMWKSDIYRVLGFYHKNNFVILTNGFQKKSQKTPSGEIDRTVFYMNDYKRRSKQ
jgi:phage-related protein